MYVHLWQTRRSLFHENNDKKTEKRVLRSQSKTNNGVKDNQKDSQLTVCCKTRAANECISNKRIKLNKAGEASQSELDIKTHKPSEISLLEREAIAHEQDALDEGMFK